MGEKKLWILGKALHKGEHISEKYSWTIYFLVDLKVVYIITYAYITIVNLISSTANSEAISDANGMVLFNVTLSPELRDVEVDSISDAILWNCRRQSVTNYYYRFLYWMLIIAMGAALLGYFVVKLMALITVSCFCKNCSCPCVLNEYGLVKLWQIAVLEQLKESSSQSQQQQQQQEQQPATGNETTSAQPKTNNEQPQSDGDHQSNTRTQVVKADIENNNDAGDANNLSGMSQSLQSSLVVQADNAQEEIEAAHDSMQITPPEVDSIKIKSDKSTQSPKFELKDYQSLLNEDMTSDIFKDLGCRSKCSNYCRQIIPGSLLFLSVITLGLAYLSYDLHPLACIVQPAEDFISYNATTKRVELNFSNHLRDFQKSAGVIVIVLTLIFFILAWRFYHLSEKVIGCLKTEAKNHVDEKTQQLKPNRLLAHREDTITGHHLQLTSYTEQ